MFADELRELARQVRHRHACTADTDTDGMLDADQLDDVCPDWRERETWACGPAGMLDALSEHFGGTTSRATCTSSGSRSTSARRGRGRHRHLRSPARTVEVDGATTLLEAGEEAGVDMPFGCRMGICHTCTCRWSRARSRDLRSGDEYDDRRTSTSRPASPSPPATAPSTSDRPDHRPPSEEQPMAYLRRPGVHPPHRRGGRGSSAPSSTRSARRSRSRAARPTATTSCG